MDSRHSWAWMARRCEEARVLGIDTGEDGSTEELDGNDPQWLQDIQTFPFCGTMSQDRPWGGIPFVLSSGDCHQLPRGCKVP
jgi:hypothetical protein